MIALVNGEHRYVLLFDDESRATAARQIAAWAIDPTLPFTWYDAAQMMLKLRSFFAS